MKRTLGTALPLGLLLVAASASTVDADRIYLKNGRIIFTEHARVEGERVVFGQYRGTVSIPMELVDRIEETEESGPEATPTPDPAEVAAAAAEGAAEGAATEGAASSGGDAATAEEEAAQAQPQEDPRQTEAYWRARLQPLFDQMTRIEADLGRFRPLAATSAEAQRQVERLESQLDGLEQRVEEIRREARGLGVPPGWLRR